MKTFIIILVVLAAIAGGGWYYWNQSHAETVEYQTGTVTRGDVTQAVTATGQLNPVVDVTVGSQISGNILKVYVDFNSLVKENEPVAELDPARTWPRCTCARPTSHSRRRRWNWRS